MSGVPAKYVKGVSLCFDVSPTLVIWLTNIINLSW